MIRVLNANDIKLDDLFLAVDNEFFNLLIELQDIKHIKYEKHIYRSKSLESVDMIYLYGTDTQVLHKLLFEDRDLGVLVYNTLSSMIKDRGRIYNNNSIEERKINESN